MSKLVYDFLWQEMNPISGDFWDLSHELNFSKTTLRPWFHSSVHLFNNNSGKGVLERRIVLFPFTSLPPAYLVLTSLLTDSCPQFFFSPLLWIITSVRDSWEAQAKIPLPVHDSHSHTLAHKHPQKTSSPLQIFVVKAGESGACSAVKAPSLCVLNVLFQTRLGLPGSSVTMTYCIYNVSPDTDGGGGGKTRACVEERSV